MSGASRENRPSEKTFREQVWGLLPNLMNCLWYGQHLAEEAINYSRMIRKSLITMEGQIQVENKLNMPENMGNISDGYHTFDELYDHRISLYIQLCKRMNGDLVYRLSGVGMESPVWKSKKHSDGSVMEGWFVLGIHKEKGKQVTYHLPLNRWDEVSFAEELELAPEWDGHTSADVLARLKLL